ncbi:MAG: type IV pilus twitching motility protein PilT [Armatimonadetes bacterium]|nr:type IV pilus twitching motility protein PilT [Armatimonadota bacterium]
MNVKLDDLLKFLVQQQGSDLLIKAESPPLVRVHGELKPMRMEPFSAEQAKEIIYDILTDEQIRRFEEDLELDLSYELPGVSRYRVNVMQQREAVGTVIRAIPMDILTMEELNLPPVLKTFCERPRGLVLVTGPTGSGKSTTLAAMIDYINVNFGHHIMTVEDPIEFVHSDKKSIINQRELMSDTLSFANALKYVLRQDPDVILVGEMRDLETIHLAITAAETGHLVFGTLHTTDAVQTVDRIVDVFPTYQQQQVRMQLAVNLVGIVSQTLLRKPDGKGRQAAFEIMVAVPSVRNLIREAKTHQIPSLVQTGQKSGMQSLDANLAELVKRRLVTFEEARSKAGNIKEFETLLGDDNPNIVRDAKGRPVAVA